MDFLLDFILHIDQYMIDIVQEYHMWAYAILFLIIFCETGLVVKMCIRDRYSSL